MTPPKFSAEQRARLRADLLEYAARDRRISGAAITGSAAAGAEDEWSDIDLALGVADSARLPDVLSDWTEHMYGQRFALHHVDVAFGAWIYRVFLLPGALQVDLAFAPAAEFRALAPSFRLMFGEASEPRHLQPPQPATLIGLAWLHALHARSSIARGHFWQAEYMISGVRDHALALACLRHGLPAAHARGFDQLPAGLTRQFEASLVRHLDLTELSRAFRVALQGLLIEVRNMDENLAGRLEATLTNLSQVSPSYPSPLQ